MQTGRSDYRYLPTGEARAHQLCVYTETRKGREVPAELKRLFPLG